MPIYIVEVRWPSTVERKTFRTIAQRNTFTAGLRKYASVTFTQKTEYF